MVPPSASLSRHALLKAIDSSASRRTVSTVIELEGCAVERWFDNDANLATWAKWFFGLVVVGSLFTWGFFHGEDPTVLIPAALCFSIAGLLYWNSFPKPTVHPQPKPPTLKSIAELKPSIVKQSSSPEETKQAKTYLTLAQTVAVDSMTERNAEKRLALLFQASRALEHVRRLDPRVSIIFNDAAATHDTVAAEVAYFESRLHYVRGEAAQDASVDYLGSKHKRFDSEMVDDYQKTAFEYYADALEPARKAVLYQPNTLLYLRHLSQVYNANHLVAEAKQVLDAAYALDPNDIETLKLMT